MAGLRVSQMLVPARMLMPAREAVLIERSKVCAMATASHVPVEVRRLNKAPGKDSKPVNEACNNYKESSFLANHRGICGKKSIRQPLIARTARLSVALSRDPTGGQR
jgi:hypothetical protein